MDTAHDEEQRSTDPGRFEGLRRPVVEVQRSKGDLIGSGLALLALLVGIPVLLLLVAGAPPIPHGSPSLRDFVQQLSVQDLLNVLLAIVWLAWAYFVVCVGVEIAAARRGGLARPLAFAGPLQKLAQVLVGAVLISGIVAGNANASTLGHEASATPVAATTVNHDVPAAAAVETTAADQTSSTVSTDAATSATGEDSLVGKKVYTVAAPKDGYHDNLWDIAEKHLGDGLRYKEIYELNKDHLQPDGRRLELSRLIQPGWRLVLPDDATGVAVVKAPAPATPDLGAPDTANIGAGASQQAVDSGTTEATHAESTASDHSNALFDGIGLLAAGIIGALALQRRRQTGRRPDGDALDTESDLRVAATLARSSWLDRALRELSLSSRKAGTTPPPAYAAIVDDDSVELLLAPAVSQAVEGWEVLDEGRRWRRERADVADELGSHEVSPYPALVSLGVDTDGRDVLVDLEAAGGVVSIDGDPVVAGEVAAAIAIQSATTPWSDAVQVVASQLPDQLSGIGNDRIRIVADLDAELTAFESQISGLRDDVLTGRLRRRGSSPSYLLVCGQAPDVETAERLGALAGAGRQAFSIVVAGDHQAARWRLHVDELGALSIPQLGLTVVANRINARQVDAVAELFAATREVAAPDDGERVAIPAPLHAHDDSVWSTAKRRVGVVGRVAVQGAGDLPADRADIAIELVTYLALHPDGVHPNVLGGILWPRGVTADVRDSTIERTRGWLGTDVDGNHFLRTNSDGRLTLADDVACDWDCIRTLLIEARRAREPKAEIDLLRRALKMVRGEAFTDVPEGRYGWIAKDDVTRTMVQIVVDSAHRLSSLLSDDDDPDGAALAAESGLRINPGSQLLWRELIRARHATLGVAGVQQTLNLMGDPLQGIPLEAETEALIEELMPTSSSFAAGS